LWNYKDKLRRFKMPYLKIYDLFISHSWKYGGEYDRMIDLLSKASYFKWRNYSCPEHDPAIDPNTEAGRNKLIQALRNQIRPVNCVIVLSGLYVTYSYWIQKEIDIAMGYDKPIIGVKPWGSQRMPKAVQEVADVIVGWNTASIIDVIRDHAL
jgi:hypothetical protein